MRPLHRRYLALCLPWLPAERAIRARLAPPDAPFALVEQQRGALRIAALDRGAARLGLERGLGLAEARARVPQLAALPFMPEEDCALTAKLALLCGDYTPSVAVDPPAHLHGILLDITGCAHLHGGEQALEEALVRRFGKLGITARAALGDTPDAARALARFSTPKALSPSGERAGRGSVSQAPRPDDNPHPNPSPKGEGLYPHAPLASDLKSLPLAALASDDEALMALRRAGFRCIGDLAELPRAPLAARFGGELVRRLGYLLGEADPHIVPRRAVEPIALCKRFAEPIARTDDVLDTIELLLVQAAAQLAQRSAGGRAFAVRLHRSDGHVAGLAVETSAPTRDPAVIMRLLRERIDSLADPLDPGFGYDAIDLTVPRSEPLVETQQALEQSTEHRKTPDLGPLLDRLAVRYGPGSVLRFASNASHIPERAGTLRAVTAAAPPPLPSPPLPSPPREAGEPPRRPLLLFDPPQRVEVIAAVPDGPPRRFAWHGRSYVAVRHEGPERIAPEWWRRRGGHDDNPGLTRDYYRVEDERGHRFWLFRHGLYSEAAATAEPPRWYVHGLFA